MRNYFIAFLLFSTFVFSACHKTTVYSISYFSDTTLTDASPVQLKLYVNVNSGTARNVTLSVTNLPSTDFSVANWGIYNPTLQLSGKDAATSKEYSISLKYASAHPEQGLAGFYTETDRYPNNEGSYIVTMAAAGHDSIAITNFAQRLNVIATVDPYQRILSFTYGNGPASASGSGPMFITTAKQPGFTITYGINASLYTRSAIADLYRN
jgi:hypothetical protein